MQFQVRAYHEKNQLDQIKNGRPAANSDRHMFLWRDSLNIFFMYRSKICRTMADMWQLST